MEATFNFEGHYFKTGQKKFIYKDRENNEHELSVKILNRILSLIANKYVRTKIKHAEYAEIASSEFSKIDPQYRYYINWLKINSIIIVDENYVPEDKSKKIKAKCKSYAFHDEFKSWGRVISMKRDHFDEVTNKDQNFLIQIDKTILKNIKRDFQNLSIRDNPIQKKYKIENQNNSIINFRSYLASEFNFWRMKNKDTFYNWKSGRLWTNFVQCSKKTRSDNFYFEEHLASCDIPSSFPLWLAVWLKNNGIDSSSYEFQEFCTLVKPQILEDGSFKQDDEGKIKTRFYEDFRQKLDNNRNILLSVAEDKKPIHCQHKEYKETEFDKDGFPLKSGWVKCKIKLDENGCCSEHGYSTGTVINNDNRSEKPHISRGQAKELFSTWLNGDNTLSTLVNAIFGIYYPGIETFVNHHKNGNKKYMYEQLVSLETNFIFNIICARLYAEIPNIQIITCHDEIYFEQKYETQVETIWNEELKKVYETLPSIEYGEEGDVYEAEI